MRINGSSPVIASEDKKEKKIQEVKATKPETYSIANSLKLDIKKSNIPATNLKLNKKDEMDETDKKIDLTNKVLTGLNTAGTVATVPGEVVKTAVSIKRTSTVILTASSLNAALSSPVKGRVLMTIASTAGKAVRITEAANVLAAKYNHAPTYNVMTKKVLPAANVVLSGIGVYINAKKFDKAMKAGDNLGMVKSGTQIALNTVSGVTGVIPGTGQTVSAIAGTATIVSDFIIDKSSRLFSKK